MISENCAGNKIYIRKRSNYVANTSAKVSTRFQVISLETRLRGWSVVMPFTAPGVLSLLWAGSDKTGHALPTYERFFRPAAALPLRPIESVLVIIS